jgi:protein dithiol oxidoreductase (disulfide-forming)
MLGRIAVLLAGMTLAAASLAQDAPFQEGRHFFRIPTAQPTSTPGKVEVIEVFSYGCPACGRFQPHIDAWKAQMPAQVQFSYLPSDFNPGWSLLARAFYAAEALGLSARSHQAIFDSNFVHGKPLRTEDDVIALLTQLGAPVDDVRKAMKSFGVDARLAQAHKRIIAYQVDSTPTLIVNGKWRVNSDGVRSHAEMIEVLNYLVQMEAAAL